MNGKNKTRPVNYTVKNIIASILQDNKRAGRYSPAKKLKLYRACRKRLQSYPALARLTTTTTIKRYPISGADNFARVGVLPPELVVVDERFKDMCTLPYWTLYNDGKGGTYRSFGKCPGYGFLPGCPPNSPAVDKVQAIIDASDFFIVLQTRLLTDRWETTWKFTVLHRLAREIEQVLGKNSITGIFGSGPCNACRAQSCLYGRPCKSPRLKTIALESMGICVDRLCSDLADCSGNSAWRISWLKHFGLPQQTPKKWKYVEALAVRVP
ncbi:DUF2284 domain-containing protein [Thermodesulfobacteriota bacterium]